MWSDTCAELLKPEFWKYIAEDSGVACVRLCTSATFFHGRDGEYLMSKKSYVKYVKMTQIVKDLYMQRENLASPDLTIWVGRPACALRILEEVRE